MSVISKVKPILVGISILIIAICVIILYHMTKPNYIRYDESEISISEDGESVILKIENPSVDFNIEKTVENNHDVYIITTWTSFWSENISKPQPQSITINPDGEFVGSVYYSGHDGGSNDFIYGTDIFSSGGGFAYLPRLFLSYYFTMALGFFGILFAMIFVFMKNKRVSNILKKLILLPASYIIALLAIKGFHTTSYRGTFDFSVILLVAILLFFSMLISQNILYNREIKR